MRQHFFGLRYYSTLCQLVLGGTTVPQYHKYRGTTARTNSHFSEDSRAKKNSLLTGLINWKFSM